MPKFHIHVRDGDQLYRGVSTGDFAGAEQVKAEAFRAIGEVMDSGLLTSDINQQQFEIFDEGGGLVATVPFVWAARLH